MDTHFERTSQMMISPGSVGVRTEWRWSGQCPSHLFNRTRSAPSAVLLIIKLSHLWDGSGQPAVLLQVCTERVRAVDGGGSLIALHLNTQVTTFTSSLDYSHLVALCSTAAHCVPGTPRRWWCSECRCYSGRRSPPLSPWTPRLTGAPDTHTHTHTHTESVWWRVAGVKRCWRRLSPVWQLLLTSVPTWCCEQAEWRGQDDSVSSVMSSVMSSMMSSWVL